RTDGLHHFPGSVLSLERVFDSLRSPDGPRRVPRAKETAVFELLWITSLGTAAIVALMFLGHWLFADDTWQTTNPSPSVTTNCDANPHEGNYDSRVEVPEEEYENIKRDLDLD
ncbi:MAG: hypothetical protein ABEN55_23220, partial [Bradymonadaceae bacterium]